MKAVIMAGGEGTRLRPLTCDLPKPMVPVLNRPVIEHIVNLLKKHGITDIAATLAYLPEKIRNHLRSGEDFEVNMNYFIEEKPLGTAGSVKNAKAFLNEDFLVISGDALTDIDLSKAIEFHKQTGSVATLVLKRVDVPLEYGVVVTSKEGHIVKFLEKPSWGEVISDTVNTGIYILSPKVFEYYGDEKCDFAQDVFPKLLEDKQPMFGYITSEYWCDIGDINAYAAANRDALNGIVKVEMPGFEFFKGVWLGKDCVIDEQVILSPRCVIGDGCVIKTGSHISENAIIGNNVSVGEHSSIKASILWNNVKIGSGSELRGALICENTVVDKRTRIFESAIVGSDCKIGQDSSVKPNVKVWPGKKIESGSEISDNVVWNTAGGFNQKSLFCKRGISGLAGSEINPIVASRLGSAFASSLRPASILSVAHDGSPLAEMVALAFLSGAAASGASCVNCKAITLPVLRFAVKEYSHHGGAYFRMTDDENLSIILVDANGCDITRKHERKVAGNYQKYDVPFSQAGNLKPIITLDNLKEHYIASFAKLYGDFKNPMTIALAGDQFIRRIAEDIFQSKGVNTCETSSGKYDLAVTFASDGESFDLYDDRGVLIKPDVLNIIKSIVLFESYEKCTLAIPVDHSSIYEELAQKYKSSLIRTGISVRDIMEKITNYIVKEGADAQISMRYDSIYCVFQIAGYLQKTGQSLTVLKAQVPDIHMKSEDIECTFDRKGKVMRKLIEENEGKAFETIDGIKIFCDKGWTLILPDSDRPVFKITAEGMNEEYAGELLADYKSKIAGYLQ